MLGPSLWIKGRYLSIDVNKIRGSSKDVRQKSTKQKKIKGKGGEMPLSSLG